MVTGVYGILKAIRQALARWYISTNIITFRALGQTDLTSADSWTMDEYDLDSSMKTNYANNTLGVRSSNKRHLICFER